MINYLSGRSERAQLPAPIPTQTGEVMEIDGGCGGGLEHSQHAPRPGVAATTTVTVPPSSPPASALPAPVPQPATLFTPPPVGTQVQWSGMVIPDSMAEIGDSQPSFPSAFSSALASAVASLAGSPAQSVVDDDGDETMGEHAARRENQADI